MNWNQAQKLLDYWSCGYQGLSMVADRGYHTDPELKAAYDLGAAKRLETLSTYSEPDSQCHVVS